MTNRAESKDHSLILHFMPLIRSIIHCRKPGNMMEVKEEEVANHQTQIRAGTYYSGSKSAWAIIFNQAF